MTPTQLARQFHDAVSHDCKLNDKGYCTVLNKAIEVVAQYEQERWSKENEIPWHSSAVC